ncbi:hypothetical protein [Actinacidiphila glaucinigra]|uniref:Uncharacterized protein n=1 Tax=Actinacidiphila glaucinigra TaxID=235986 RepID=A0A239KDE3_9ACTN|nr:hypothetical protein [Actinacidiphila glaucinigra]SNT16151.1 hypothetical protein SAMN05216252_115136 [Actinacidiphila glaucinigra]
MTPDQDRHTAQEDWLRDAFVRSRDAYPSSQAPVERILATARARRKRHRAATAVGAVAGAACVLAAALAVALQGPHPSAGPAQRSSPAASPTATATPGPLTVSVDGGTTGGAPWSVTLEFHRSLPEGYELPTAPDGTTASGTALLCQRMYIGGVRIDHQGGPWSDCQPVTGSHDPAGSGSMGLWGFHGKGTSGSRLMVSNAEADIAYGIVNLTDGTHLKANTVTVPGTDYRAWAVAIPNGKTISAVDQYDKRHHRLTHETQWR